LLEEFHEICNSPKVSVDLETQVGKYLINIRPNFGSKTNVSRREKPMLPRKQKKAFNEFYKAARYNQILDPKTTLLIHMAAAISVACYP
jgi:hypothetical protein